MKLMKLSLVAALAATAFSSTASATPLEELVKDVDASGYLRVRYTHDTEKKEYKVHGHTITEDKDGDSTWNFKTILTLKSKIDDNFFALASIRYSDDDEGETESSSSSKEEFDINQAYIGYKYGGTTAIAGRYTLGTFFTDDMYGDGVKVTNNDVEGLTMAVLFADSLEKDGDIGSLALGRINGKYTSDHNLFGFGTVGSFDPVSFQVWYASLNDVAGLFAAELSGDFAINDDFSIGALAQYGFAEMDNDFVKATGNVADNSNFYAGQLSTEFLGFDLAAGYLNFSTDTDKVSLTSFEDQGSFVSPGEQLLDYTLYAGENQAGFATIGYSFFDKKLRIGGDYIGGKRTVKNFTTGKDEDYDMSEWVARIEYKYNDKLKFKSYYSHAEDEFLLGDDVTNDEIRFEAKYSF